MFVFNQNEQDISFITIYYPSILVISFIFYMTKLFPGQDEINSSEIF